MDIDKKGAGVKFPPPLIFAAAIGLGLILEYYCPWAIIFVSNFSVLAVVLKVVGGMLIGLATVLIALAVIQLHRAKTSIEPWKPTSSIISAGVFGLSRNPIYLAFIGIAVGVALYLLNVWIMMAVFPAVWVIKVFVIKKEERYLQQKFGEQYAHYCASVRRWI